MQEQRGGVTTAHANADGNFNLTLRSFVGYQKYFEICIGNSYPISKTFYFDVSKIPDLNVVESMDHMMYYRQKHGSGGRLLDVNIVHLGRSNYKFTIPTHQSVFLGFTYQTFKWHIEENEAKNPNIHVLNINQLSDLILRKLYKLNFTLDGIDNVYTTFNLTIDIKLKTSRDIRYYRHFQPYAIFSLSLPDGPPKGIYVRCSDDNVMATTAIDDKPDTLVLKFLKIARLQFLAFFFNNRGYLSPYLTCLMSVASALSWDATIQKDNQYKCTISLFIQPPIKLVRCVAQQTTSRLIYVGEKIELKNCTLHCSFRIKTNILGLHNFIMDVVDLQRRVVVQSVKIVFNCHTLPTRDTYLDNDNCTLSVESETE